MIVRIVRQKDPAAPAAVRVHPDGIAFETALPEDFGTLPPHLALGALGSARLRDAVALAFAADHEIRLAYGRMTDDGYRERTVDRDAYRLATGAMSLAEAEARLRRVFDGYPDYQDFDAMVREFAGDDFYALHHLACEYLAAATPAPPAP